MDRIYQSKLKILITRPAHQAQSLSDAIRQAGGQPVLFPTLTITDPPDITALQQIIITLPQADIAIFTSVNAVEKAIPHIQLTWQKWPTHLRIVAIGAATTQALSKHGLSIQDCPSQFNSEGLLGLPCLHEVQNKTVVIFKGLGGRDLLTTTLQQRGATIIEAIVYQRGLPIVDIMDYLPSWQADGIDVIISTSQESLQNLVTLIASQIDSQAGSQAHNWLLNLPLIVISERMAIFAQDIGFKQPPMVANNASDAALLAAFIHWRNKHD
jgi:uroporphyrinogen-III synthase